MGWFILKLLKIPNVNRLHFASLFSQGFNAIVMADLLVWAAQWLTLPTSPSLSQSTTFLSLSQSTRQRHWRPESGDVMTLWWIWSCWTAVRARPGIRQDLCMTLRHPLILQGNLRPRVHSSQIKLQYVMCQSVWYRHHWGGTSRCPAGVSVCYINEMESFNTSTHDLCVWSCFAQWKGTTCYSMLPFLCWWHLQNMQIDLNFARRFIP